MLVACRLAGLSALEAYYARIRVGAQFRVLYQCVGELMGSVATHHGEWAGD